MSNGHELIRIARNSIGEGNSDEDWKIVPTEHGRIFEADAPSLSEILGRSDSNGLAEIYEAWNDKAITARDEFKNTVNKANKAIFSTACFGVLILIGGGLHSLIGDYCHWVIRGVCLLGFISSGLSAMWLSQVRGNALSQKWAERRAKAEAKRLVYFKNIMERAKEDPLDQLLVLEYTRRFLLDNQIDYFHERGDQHEKAANVALKKSTIAVFVSSFFTALAGVLSMVWLEFAAIAGLGVISAAYASMAASRSAVNQDRKNAARYLAAEYQLKERRLDLDKYREKTAMGIKGAVEEFFEPVFITLEADHKAFLNEAEQREAAIGEMETRLDAAKKPLEEKISQKSDNM